MVIAVAQQRETGKTSLTSISARRSRSRLIWPGCTFSSGRCKRFFLRILFVYINGQRFLIVIRSFKHNFSILRRNKMSFYCLSFLFLPNLLLYSCARLESTFQFSIHDGCFIHSRSYFFSPTTPSVLISGSGTP